MNDVDGELWQWRRMTQSYLHDYTIHIFEIKIRATKYNIYNLTLIPSHWSGCIKLVGNTWNFYKEIDASWDAANYVRSKENDLSSYVYQVYTERFHIFCCQLHVIISRRIVSKLVSCKLKDNCNSKFRSKFNKYSCQYYHTYIVILF